MSLILNLSTLALRQIVDSAGSAVGVQGGGDLVVGFLTDRFIDHSQRLTEALKDTNERAWWALEISLTGECFWDRCKAMLARAEDKAFARQVRAFLDATPWPELSGKQAFRKMCLDELRAARKVGLLTGGTLDPKQLAKQTGDFARFGDPKSLLDGEWRLVNGMAEELKRAGYANLAWLVAHRPAHGTSVLVAGARYFFAERSRTTRSSFKDWPSLKWIG